jgi:formylmethanofuran dehydrogenase subunit E
MNLDISQVMQFRGHTCPGLAIGIRVAEQALVDMGERPGDEGIVVIVETDNCAWMPSGSSLGAPLEYTT